MIKDDVKLSPTAVVYQPDLVNLYGCEIGDETKIGAFVEIRKDANIGARCKIQAFVFRPMAAFFCYARLRTVLGWPMCFHRA